MAQLHWAVLSGRILARLWARGGCSSGWLWHQGHTLSVLQKLPFTIPELVQSSPCRSSDGVLYTGMRARAELLLGKVADV